MQAVYSAKLAKQAMDLCRMWSHATYATYGWVLYTATGNGMAEMGWVGGWRRVELLSGTGLLCNLQLAIQATANCTATANCN